MWETKFLDHSRPLRVSLFFFPSRCARMRCRADRCPHGLAVDEIDEVERFLMYASEIDLVRECSHHLTPIRITIICTIFISMRERSLFSTAVAHLTPEVERSCLAHHRSKTGADCHEHHHPSTSVRRHPGIPSPTSCEACPLKAHQISHNKFL